MRMRNFTFFSYSKFLHLSFIICLLCDESLPLLGEGEHKEKSHGTWYLLLIIAHKKMQGRDGPILDNSSCLFFESSLPIHSLRCCIVGENMSKWAVSLKLSLNHREFCLPRGEELLWFITNLLLTEVCNKIQSSFFFAIEYFHDRNSFTHRLKIQKIYAVQLQWEMNISFFFFRAHWRNVGQQKMWNKSCDWNKNKHIVKY